MEDWKQRFKAKFVQRLERGAFWLFRVNPDGSESIATPKDVEEFIQEERRKAQREVIKKAIQEIDKYCAGSEFSTTSPESVKKTVIDYLSGFKQSLSTEQKESR